MQERKLTNEQARRFMLLKQGLLGGYKFSGKRGVCDFVRQAGCVQFDPIDVCGKNAELVLQSRVKGFTKAMLYELLYEDRRLIDYFDKNMSLWLMQDWPYFKRFRQWHSEQGASRTHVDEISEQLKRQIKQQGFACSKDFEHKTTVDWYWSPTTLSRAALETLYFRGELIIHHKKGSIKYYALAEDYLGPELLQEKDPNPTDDEYLAWQVKRRIGAVGLLWNRPSDAWLGIGGMKSDERNRAFAALLERGDIYQCSVDGIPDTLYYLAQDDALMDELHKPHKKRLEFLAPLDNMLWDRRLIKALFGFDYKWEIYTPAAQRKYGYYVLPVLYGSGFAGRAEIVKEGDALVLRRFWPEGKTDSALKGKLEDALTRFAAFNGCGEVRETV